MNKKLLAASLNIAVWPAYPQRISLLKFSAPLALPLLQFKLL